jgi:hypothetical protein
LAQADPISVHPEFRDRVWSALQYKLSGDKEALGRWRVVCQRQSSSQLSGCLAQRAIKIGSGPTSTA